MVMRRMVAAAALAGLLSSTSAWAQTCAAPDDERALQVRVLQTELMVAALSCQQQDPYNAFVTRFQPVLAVHGKALKKYFKRIYGGSSTVQLDEFVTRLANEASLRGMRDLRGFCGDSLTLFKSIEAVETTGLERFVAGWERRDVHGVLPCVQQAANP
jgi:hypothetical protein